MLQDLAYGRLENEFYHLQPSPEDLVICFQNNQVLLKQEGDQFLLPTVAEVTALTERWDPWYEEGLRYVFRLQEKNFFLWLLLLIANIIPNVAISLRHFRAAGKNEWLALYTLLPGALAIQVLYCILAGKK